MGDLEGERILSEITTWPQKSSLLYKVTSQALYFEVKGCDAVITLSDHPNSGCEDRFDIKLGNESHIDYGAHDSALLFDTPGLVSGHEYRGFWLTWFNAIVRVGRSGEQNPFMTHRFTLSTLSSGLALEYVRFGVLDTFSRPVSWRFALSPVKRSSKIVKPVKGGKAEWMPCDDQLPDNALIGGYCTDQKENLYIIRAKHRGSVTPGKFVPSEGLGYIPWGGAANEKDTFESSWSRKTDEHYTAISLATGCLYVVLCGFNTQWVPTRSNEIPAGAIAGGTSEDRNETLYVGRAYHKGHLIPGKVQPSHRVCYIPYEDREIANVRYEILIDPEHAQSGDTCTVVAII